MKFCTVCGKQFNDNGVCECGNTAPAAQVMQQAAPMQQQVGQMPVPGMVAMAPQGPGFMDQVKKVFRNGFKLFSKPGDAINETSNDSDIKNLFITIGVSTIVLFVSIFLFAKVFTMFNGLVMFAQEKEVIEYMCGEDAGKFPCLTSGTIKALDQEIDSEYFSSIKEEMEFENWLKLFVACFLSVAVFFALHALMAFIIAKLDKKTADFNNVLVSSNIISIVITVFILAFALVSSINGTLALAMILFMLVYYGMLSYQYLKTKFDVAIEKLTYLIPLMVIINVSAGLYISGMIIDALKIMGE